MIEVRMLIKEGGAIARPTDTAYGIEEMAESIKRIKCGGEIMPMLVLNVGKVLEIAEVNETAMKLINFWPGPFTVVLKNKADFPRSLINEGFTSIRASNHDLALEIKDALGNILIGTSACFRDPFCEQRIWIRGWRKEWTWLWMMDQLN